MADHYCTVDDVNALVPQAPFSASSRPTSATVEKFIASTARRIDAIVADLGYVVPVTTGTQSLELLREACAWGALGLALGSRDTGVTMGPNGGAQSNFWMRQFENWLKALADPQNTFNLPDATATGDKKQQGADLLRSNVESDLDRFVDNPPVTRDQVL